MPRLTGCCRGVAAILIALSALSHLIPGLFAAIAVVLILVARGVIGLPSFVGRMLVVPEGTQIDEPDEDDFFAQGR